MCRTVKFPAVGGFTFSERTGWMDGIDYQRSLFSGFDPLPDDRIDEDELKAEPRPSRTFEITKKEKVSGVD